MKLLSVVGARPNFVKIAPLMRAIENANGKFNAGIQHKLVHTGQHYDAEMSQSFFDELGIAYPDVELGVGSGSHAQQVGQTMIAFEPVVQEYRPDWIVIVGDVNATCACSITAKKEHIKLAHVEAGLRSFDLDMPEELNRLVADRLADAHFTTDSIACTNLIREGVSQEKIHLVGNIMIDTLEATRKKASELDLDWIIKQNETNYMADSDLNNIREGQYAMVTLHRPSNVDDPAALSGILNFLIKEVAAEMPIIWPIHPRTRNRILDMGFDDQVKKVRGLHLLPPVGYMKMLRLNLGAKIALTDSGGLQEECCVLGTPCLTLRFNTERPVTLEANGGTCVLVGNDPERMRDAFHRKKKEPKTPFRPPLWDGRTAVRILEKLTTQS